LEEFQAAHARIFKAIDADKNGTLTLEEMQSFLRGAEKGTPEQLGSAVLNGRPRLFSEQCLRRRWLRGTSRLSANELLLNLQRDSRQPLLGAVRSLLVVPGVGIKLSYPVFSGSKLSG
jgi:hypothetical protein